MQHTYAVYVGVWVGWEDIVTGGVGESVDVPPSRSFMGMDTSTGADAGVDVDVAADSGTGRGWIWLRVEVEETPSGIQNPIWVEKSADISCWWTNPGIPAIHVPLSLDELLVVASVLVVLPFHPNKLFNATLSSPIKDTETGLDLIFSTTLTNTPGGSNTTPGEVERRDLCV